MEGTQFLKGRHTVKNMKKHVLETLKKDPKQAEFESVSQRRHQSFLDNLKKQNEDLMKRKYEKSQE